MISEEEAVSLLKEANPVPSLDGYELDDIGPAEYLALLERMRTQDAQTTFDQPTESADEHVEGGKKHLAWAAAAVVILIAGLTIGVLRPDSDGSVVATDPKPTTTTELTPSTTTESAASTTVPATTVPESALSGIPVWLGSGDGQWVPAQASVQFAFTTGSDWNSAHVWNTPDRFTICVPEDKSPHNSRCSNGSVSVLRLDQGNIEATKEFLSSVEGAELSGEERVSIGGADGIRFTFTHDISPTPGGQAQPDLDVPSAVSFGNENIPIGAGPLGTGLVSIVDVAGETMTITFQGEDSSKGAIEDGFHVNMQKGLQIIDSIIWAALQ